MTKNIKLNMSRRIRRTPFTNKVEECGVSDFTVVNHMLLPKGFKNSIEEDYWHLSQHVQIWDVSCQRQVQITGPDASKLVQLMTPRSLKNMETGKCFYIPIIDENAGMINDPVLLKLDDEDCKSEYEMVCKTGDYFSEKKIISEIVVKFKMPNPNKKYHIPIIISPNGYSIWWSD